MNISVKANKIYLLLLYLLLFGLLSACSNQAPATNSLMEPLGPPDRVDIVYFYKGDECRCQEAVGDRINATVFINFSEELTGGKLTLQSLNLDDKENVTIAYKYEAIPESLFINIVRADTENIIAVPEISLVKDDYATLDRLMNNRIRRYLDGEE